MKEIQKTVELESPSGTVQQQTIVLGDLEGKWFCSLFIQGDEIQRLMPFFSSANVKELVINIMGVKAVPASDLEILIGNAAVNLVARHYTLINVVGQIKYSSV